MKNSLLTLFLAMSLSAYAQQETINIGGSPHSGNADTPREAFEKVNNNFDVLFARVLNVADFGAVGDAVADDSDAIQEAITAAGIGGKIVFGKDKTYVIKETLIPLNGQRFVGTNSVIKRADASTSVLLSAYTPGGTSIIVADASTFSVGQVIALFDVTSTNGGEGYNESSATSDTGGVATITSISGTTINFTGNLSLPSNGNLTAGGVWPVGTRVATLFTMVRVLNTSNYSNIVLDGITFDGNKANNTQTSDWRLNKTGDFGVINGGVIRNCRFINTPSENIFINSNTLIENCTFEDLNGSGIHISSNRTDGNNKILHNRFTRTNIKGNEVMTHSEAAITYSAAAKKSLISGNIFEDSDNGYCVAPYSSDDAVLVFTDNQCYNMAGVLQSPSPATLPNYIHMEGNIFDTCVGLITLVTSASSVPNGGGWDQFSIVNNTFKNTQIQFNNVTNGKVTGNTFVTDTGFLYPSGQSSILYIQGGGNLVIANNQFYHDNTLDPTVTTAIHINNSTGTVFTPVYKDGVTATVYSYYQDIQVTGNVITGFSKGIDETHGSDLEMVNFLIANNIVNCLDLTGSQYGIAGGCGVVITGNIVNTNNNCTSGISLKGAVDGSATLINGPICHGNFIYGDATNSIIIGTASNARNNIMCNYNYVTGAVLNTYSGFNPAPVGNVTMPLTARPRPVNVYRTNIENY